MQYQGTKAAWPRSRGLHSNVGTPSISPERLKLELGIWCLVLLKNAQLETKGRGFNSLGQSPTF